MTSKRSTNNGRNATKEMMEDKTKPITISVIKSVSKNVRGAKK